MYLENKIIKLDSTYLSKELGREKEGERSPDLFQPYSVLYQNQVFVINKTNKRLQIFARFLLADFTRYILRMPDV
jgi:hypothetical protein